MVSPFPSRGRTAMRGLCRWTATAADRLPLLGGGGQRLGRLREAEPHHHLSPLLFNVNQRSRRLANILLRRGHAATAPFSVAA
nr:hypothetical protein Itr_chr08CG11930 [Ipomoea trifida]GLL33477.1 hypothetical protein Itr_chr08CG11940 [Ipomoea trifida]